MTTVPLSQFNAGELSQLLSGRHDLPAYAAGLARGLNCIATPQGPLVRRPGKRRAADMPPTALHTASWVFGVGDSYSLVFSDNRLAFVRADRSPVLFDGQLYQIDTPWTAAQARTLRWYRSGDVMWLAHPEVPLQELRRTALSPETFTLAPAVFIDGPYYPENATPTTVTTGATGTGAIAVSASAPVWTGVAADHIGNHFRVKLGVAGNQSWAWGKITGWTNAQSISVTFVTEVATAGASAAWRLGLYGPATGYPACVCIHQERLILGSNIANSFPRVDGSNSGKFLTFKPGTDDDNALQIVAATRDVPVIRDVVSESILLVVTGSGVLRAVTSGTSSALTPTNVDIAPLPTSTGGSLVPAVQAAGGVLYLDRQRRSLGELKAVSANNPSAFGYREISIRSEHLFRDSPIVSLAWSDKPWGLVAAVREDGVYLLGAYAPDHEVIAFTPQQAAGAAHVLSCNVLPTFDGDEIHLLVDRGGLRTVEVLSNPLRNTDPDREAINLDGAITWRDTPAATLTRISGSDDGLQVWQASADVFAAANVDFAIRVLSRGTNNKFNLPTWVQRTLRIKSVDSASQVTVLREGPAMAGPIAAGTWTRTATTIPGFAAYAGQSIRILADGGDLGAFTVAADGTVALPHEASIVTGGEAYRSECQPMPPNPQTRKGGAVGRPQADVRPRLRVVRSGGLKQMNWDGVARSLLPVRRGVDPSDMPPPFYSGDMEMDGDSHSDTPVAPFIVADGALPFTITAFNPEVAVGEVG